MTVTTPRRVDSREALILAAERLVAERGAKVPLRDIAIEAGQRNNSAVNYHFGSREGLLHAVVERRNAALEERRMQLLAEREATGIRELLEVLISPMLTVPYEEGSTHYARFLEQVRGLRLLERPVLSPEWSPAVQVLMTRLHQAIRTRTGLPEAAAAHRLSSMATAMFALLADAERAREEHKHHDSGPEVVTMLEGLLTAVPA
jgi:AcrR family transcriptional regulator